MISLLFLPFEGIQILSSLETLRQINAQKSIYAISLDFTMYSWVWALTHTIANSLYSFLPNVEVQYSNRFPIYPELPCLNAFPILSALQLCLCTMLLKKCFFGLKSLEQVSVVCKTILIACSLVFSCFFWLFCNGRATINALDIADCLHNIGSIAFACRLVPQISMNWFLDIFALSDTFLVLQYSAVIFGSFVRFIAYFSGMLWFELPIELPSQLVLGSTGCILVVLTYQRKRYGPQRGPLSRASSSRDKLL